MKKNKINIINFLICLLLSNVAFSQVIVDTVGWAPPGAIWIYRNTSMSSNLNTKLEYVSDTIMLGVTAKKLIVSRINYVGFPPLGPVGSINEIGAEYMYESNDSVFWYDKINHEFDFMYKFKSPIGTKYALSNSRAVCPSDSTYPDSDTVAILAVTTDTFSNRVFKYRITSLDKHYIIGKIIDRIGSMDYPFPQINGQKCVTLGDVLPYTEYGAYYDGLACYYDDIRGWIIFENLPFQPCEYLTLGTVGIQETLFSSHEYNFLQVFPNPTYDYFQINESKRINSIDIYDIQGRVVKQILDYQTNVKINISTLSNGVYFIQAKMSDKSVSIAKILKQ